MKPGIIVRAYVGRAPVQLMFSACTATRSETLRNLPILPVEFI
jgi:hypothetical protein